jgi:hypothetical protein
MPTETEAKNKWCPFAKVQRPCSSDEQFLTDGNREWHSGLPSLETMCIGSTCMAWRKNVKCNSTRDVCITDSGYCGLAGKP